LEQDESAFVCINAECKLCCPIVDGVPVLLNESNSIFSFTDFTQRQATTFQPATAIDTLEKFLPKLFWNPEAPDRFCILAEKLLKQTPQPQVLIVGGGVLGEGVRVLLEYPAIQLTETDVYFGERTQLICDGHDLPFDDGTFDAVVVQAVLEHVLDPYRCVSEIRRVLCSDGLVYAETPFMQQVHMREFDFTRFTHLGHRRLFRMFSELDSGAIGSAGQALGLSWRYFLLSFFRGSTARAGAGAFARLTGFWWKYFDNLLAHRPASMDAATGYYFFGRKSEIPLPDRELIKQYRGAF
jgi:SAM-dependent methyltransferase